MNFIVASSALHIVALLGLMTGVTSTFSRSCSPGAAGQCPELSVATATDTHTLNKRTFCSQTGSQQPFRGVFLRLNRRRGRILSVILSHCANSLIYSVWISHIDLVTVIYEGEVESLTEYR